MTLNYLVQNKDDILMSSLFFMFLFQNYNYYILQIYIAKLGKIIYNIYNILIIDCESDQINTGTDGCSTRIWLDAILKKKIGQVLYWSKVDKDDYLLAMECSPVKELRSKYCLKRLLLVKLMIEKSI